MRKLLFIFTLFLASTAGAQKLLHYDLADGLSSSEITSICENDYYMWIATEDGLNVLTDIDLKSINRENQ